MEMPLYEFYCPKCDREVRVTLTLSEKESGTVDCPACGGKELQPLMAAFFSKTSRKS